MKMISVKRFSILGLVLIAASAVTAAIIPGKEKSDSARFAKDGTLTPSASNPSGLTCKATLVTVKTCHNTVSAAASAATGDTVFATNPTKSNQTTGSDDN